jgi:hypothetical protein
MSDTKNDNILSDGRAFEIIELTGDDSLAVQETIGEGEAKKEYLAAIMARGTIIAGNKVVPEDIKALKMRDFNKVQKAFGEVNF